MHYAHIIKALVICNLLMVNYYKINIYTHNLYTLMSAIIPPIHDIVELVLNLEPCIFQKCNTSDVFFLTDTIIV